MKFGLIGHGAIAQYVVEHLGTGDLAYVIARPGREAAAREALGFEGPVGVSMDGAPAMEVLVDCAGHAGLQAHGAAALGAGVDVLTVSIGALAEQGLYDDLTASARAGGSACYLATGAIGVLDAVAAGAVGGLSRVQYTGRKPPGGWRGSPAEAVLDLDALTEATAHFEGTAREAALGYPKNANVAAAVALAGTGFDATQVRLIADPGVTENIHEIEAEGAFGRLTFQIAGNTLASSPRTSALAAMSVVKALRDRSAAIRI